MKIKKPKLKKDGLWFISDPHFFHKRMVPYRGFKTVEEMNEQLIENWNSCVKLDHTIICLGDFSFGGRHDTYSLIRRLNGHKWWIKGNHDDGLINEPMIQTLFDYTGYYTEIDVLDDDRIGNPTDFEEKKGRQRIILFHYNIHIWNKMQHGAWHLYGHSHGNAPNDQNRSEDVGVDRWGLLPVSYEQIKQVMATRTFIPRDHHGDPAKGYKD